MPNALDQHLAATCPAIKLKHTGCCLYVAFCVTLLLRRLLVPLYHITSPFLLKTIGCCWNPGTISAPKQHTRTQLGHYSHNYNTPTREQFEARNLMDSIAPRLPHSIKLTRIPIFYPTSKRTNPQPNFNAINVDASKLALCSG